jgi:hypothetical protein
VILLDANLLLYAYNADSPQSKAAAAWIGGTLAGGESTGLPLPTICAFLRIAANAHLWSNPIPSGTAVQFVRGLLAHPGAMLLAPGTRHLERLAQLTAGFGVAGPLFSGAVLAAMALEDGAEVASTDQDFRRFPTVRWINSLAGPRT